MKAIIFIEANAALLAGVNNQGEYTIDFDPADLTPEQRAELATCPIGRVGEPYQTHKGGAGGFVGDGGTGITTPDLAALRAVLDARIARRAEDEAKKAAKAAEQRADQIERAKKWAELPADDRVDSSWQDGWHVKTPYMPGNGGNFGILSEISNELPEVALAMEEALSLVCWMEAETGAGKIVTKRRNKAIADAEAAAAAEQDQRRAAQLAAYVEAHGDDNQRGRMKEGLLPESEILDMIRAEAYAPMADWPRYKKLRAGDVCNGAGDYADSEYHDVDFSVGDADELTAGQYDDMVKIRELMPDAEVDARIHTAECDECETEVSRIGFMVRATVGELEFSREYGESE